ncbi:MAG: fimbrillin family protein, partial [Bacteroidales bacterium]|nr:fimbrillin family protein [Bacteroidales bacterium]
MKTLRILSLLTVAVTVLSCMKDPEPSYPDGFRKSNVEVKASASLPDGWTPMTKAVGDITDIDNSELQSRGFGVYAFYTGSEGYSAAKDSSAYTNFGLVLKNRKFSYSAGVWNNTGRAEFWPTADDDNLSLFAYAPWDTWNGVVSYNGKVPTIQYDSYVAQNLSVSELSKQRDILWGTNTSGDPHKNVKKDDYATEGTVDFHFRHAVAKVRLNV